MDDLLPPSMSQQPVQAEGGQAASTATIQPGPQQPEDENQEPLIGVGGWLEGSPAWLVSAVLHLLIILIAALAAYSTSEEATLNLTAIFSEDPGEQLLEEALELSPMLDIEVEEQVITPDIVEPVIEPLALPAPSVVVPDGETFTTSIANPTIGSALNGRTPGMKQAMLKAYGGTEETEQAVLDGLRWLSKQQAGNGSWSLKGPYSDGYPSRNDNPEAATAMALLAYQGAGHLPGDKSSKFSRNVRRGWNWLLERQQADGSFFHSGAHSHRFYTHAQCTIALCELYGMTKDEQYQVPAQKAVTYLVDSQHSAGGWRYRPANDSDLSVTGWVLMALKSARMSGIHVPSSTFEKISEFLDTVSKVDGSRYVYVYTEAYNPESLPTMTAEGLLCRQYLGWPKGDIRLRKGVDHILDNLPEWKKRRRDVYYWYYATQVCRHMGGGTWETWNKSIRNLLPDHQVRRGREKGSWDPTGDRWAASSAGRLYQTCMSLYILEVYYRHLPLYQQDAIQGAF